jgi:hypothetical protein
MTRGSDGLNHQGAIAIVVNPSDLTLVKNLGQTSGHSFANSLTMGSNGNFLGMDLGDNYPRGIHAWEFDSSGNRVGSWPLVYTFKTLHGQSPQNAAGKTFPVYSEISGNGKTFYKFSNDNNVYTELAHSGLVETDDGIIFFFAGERPPLDNSKVGKLMNEPRNLGFTKRSKDLKQVLSPGATENGLFYNFGGGETSQTNKGITFLTDYTALGECVSRPKTARLAKGSNLLTWEIWTETSFVRSELMTVDDNGARVLPVQKPAYPMRLPIADDLIIRDGVAVAYAGTGKGILARVEVNS